jgi:type IV pilus assembly protein PilV
MFLNSPRPQPRVRSRVAGISLVESLIAVLVMALGVLGLASVQARLLAENRTSNQRAIAIGLIDDLANRMLLNRNAALAGNYAVAWSTAVAAQNCTTGVCTGAQLAQSDMNLWLASVAQSLPGANASVFVSPTDARQIGIAVAWSSNEGKAADSNTAYTAPFSVTSGNAGVDCPANSICHIVYVQP